MSDVKLLGELLNLDQLKNDGYTVAIKTGTNSDGSDRHIYSQPDVAITNSPEFDGSIGYKQGKGEEITDYDTGDRLQGIPWVDDYHYQLDHPVQEEQTEAPSKDPSGSLQDMIDIPQPSTDAISAAEAQAQAEDAVAQMEASQSGGKRGIKKRK